MILGAGPIVIGQVRVMRVRAGARMRANEGAVNERFETASSVLNISNRARDDAIASTVRRSRDTMAFDEAVGSHAMH